MANDVFANGREISCKAGSGKSICAFPDVCFTPPENPATPPGTPIPYPNTGMASDTTSGSKKVKISNKEVMLKNKSHFKKSVGDEAGCAAKKGVVTSTNRGKVYFNAWSMDVKIEGKNAVRHLDLTTHNHRSMPANTPTWPYMDEQAFPTGGACEKDKEKTEDACKDEYEPYGDEDPCPPHTPPSPPSFAACSGLTKRDQQLLSNNLQLPSMQKGGSGRLSKDRVEELRKKYKSTPEYSQFNEDTTAYYDALAGKHSGVGNDKKQQCLRARRCMLVPKKSRVNQPSCCPGQTPHHLVEGASFKDMPGCGDYNYDKAPCICVEGQNQNTATHGLMHTFQSQLAAKKKADDGTQSLLQANNSGARAVTKVFPESGCSEKCIKAQVANYHKSKGMNARTRVKAVETGETSAEAIRAAEARVGEKEEIWNEVQALNRIAGTTPP